METITTTLLPDFIVFVAAPALSWLVMNNAVSAIVDAIVLYRAAAAAEMPAATNIVISSIVRPSIIIADVLLVLSLVMLLNAVIIHTALDTATTGTTTTTTTTSSTNNSAAAKILSVVISLSRSLVALDRLRAPTMVRRHIQSDDYDDEEEDIDYYFKVEHREFDEETFNAVVDHPYLKRRFPKLDDNDWTLRKVRRYERKILETIADQIAAANHIPDELPFVFDDWCVDYWIFSERPRLAELQFCLDDFPIVTKKIALPEDIAILDQLERIHFDGRYLSSVPASIKYLTKLRSIMIHGCDDEFTIASDSMSNLDVNFLCLEDCTGRTIVEFFDLPSLKEIYVVSSEPEQLTAFLSNLLHRTDAPVGGSVIDSTRICRFRMSLEAIQFWGLDITTHQFCRIITELPRLFPNLTSIGFEDIAPVYIEEVIDHLKKHLETEDLTGSFRHLKVGLMDIPHASTTDSLQSLLDLLELNNFCHVTYVGHQIGSCYDNIFVQQRREDAFREVQLKIVNVLHQNSVGRVLTRQPEDDDNSKTTLPLSVWTKIIHRASTKLPTYSKCGKNFDYVTSSFRHPSVRLTEDQKSEEEKEWKATSIFYLLKEGLAPNDEWRELITKNKK